MYIPGTKGQEELLQEYQEKIPIITHQNKLTELSSISCQKKKKKKKRFMKSNIKMSSKTSQRRKDHCISFEVLYNEIQ